MAIKTSLNTKPAIPQLIDNKFQEMNDLQIPTPEELGFGSNDFNPPLPQPELAKDEKKGFFSKFSKKSEPQKVEPKPMPEIPNPETFSFPEFDKNPIQPVQNISIEKSLETEFLKNKSQTPLEMPKLEKAPKAEKKIEAQELIDSHSIDDEETFNSISDKLNEIEAALKKHLDEIEQKMSVVKNIEKELKTLDVKIVKTSLKKSSKPAKNTLKATKNVPKMPKTKVFGSSKAKLFGRRKSIDFLAHAQKSKISDKPKKIAAKKGKKK